MIGKNGVSLVALAGSLAMVSAPALAQTTTTDDTNIGQSPQEAAAKAATAAGETPPAAQPGGDIVVTGTRIVRPNVTAAAPITSVTSADIRAQAAVNVEDVLNRLPQIAPDAQQTYNDSDGRQRIKLRSLGFERTLVLIDGKRLGTQNGQDTGIIPTTLLERVDVLTGGASSVYGSDAVAGVVNFVLKKDFEGLQLDANYNFYNHNNKDTVVSPLARAAGFTSPRGWTNDGGRADLTLTAGHGFFDDKVHVSGFVNYKNTDEVALTSRSNAGCYLTQLQLNGPLSCGLTPSSSTSGLITPQSGPNAGAQLVNNPNGTRTFVPFGAGQGNASNYFSGYAYQRPSERVNAGGFVTAELAPEAELYASGLWFRDKSYTNYPTIASGTVNVSCANPFLSASQATAIGCGVAGATSVPVSLAYRLGEMNDRPDTFVNTGVRLTGGVRGKVGDAWTYDVGGVYARNHQDYIPSFRTPGNLQNAVNVGGTAANPVCASGAAGCVPFDIFSAGNTNPALINYLFTTGTSQTTGTLYDVLANVSGDLGKYGITSPFAEQGVAIALGAEYRKDTLKSTADASYRSALGGTDSYLSQDVWEANAEVQVPLIEHKPFVELAQVNGGYRLSKYSSNPSTFNTWKIEGIYAPVKDITFRASFNKAQRAPTVIEADQASNVNYTTSGPNDPCASTRDPNSSNPNVRVAPTASIEQCRRTGLPDNLYGSATLDCSALNTGCTVRNGGFNLKPETAYTKTFGVILRPRFVRGLTVSADRFIINLNDSINFFQVNDFLNGCLTTGLQYYCRGIVRNPGTYTLNSAPGGNPTTGYYARGTSNSYKSQSHGWDFQGQYTLGLAGAGSLDTSFNGTLTTRVGSQDTPDATPRNCVGYYGPGCGESMPRWSHGLRTTWTSADKVASVSLNWRHISGMTISYNAPADTGIPANTAQFRRFYTGVPTYDYIDLSTSFDIAKRFALRVSVNNLFDRDPPLLPDSRNVLGLLRSNTLFRYDLLGRQIVVGATARF